MVVFWLHGRTGPAEHVVAQLITWTSNAAWGVAWSTGWRAGSDGPRNVGGPAAFQPGRNADPRVGDCPPVKSQRAALLTENSDPVPAGCVAAKPARSGRLVANVLPPSVASCSPATPKPEECPCSKLAGGSSSCVDANFDARMVVHE